MNQAGWLLAQVADKGLDLAAWPESTRVVALGLDAATWDAAGIIQRGAAGGEAPRPYPDKGHLLDSPDGHGAPEGACAPDGTSWPPPFEPNPTYSVRDDVHANPATVAETTEKVRKRRRGDQGKPWDRRQRIWLEEIALRARIEEATGDPIRDRDGFALECANDGWVFQHTERREAFQLRVHTCKKRGRCPHCGRAYGDEKAGELLSLLHASLDRREEPLKRYDALGWGIILTLPEEVSAHLGALADDFESKKALSAELTKFVRLVKRFLLRFFHLEGEPEQLGAVLNLHWWSSKNPLNPHRWHAHVIVPNVRRDGGELRRKALFSPDAIHRARQRLGVDLAAAWPGLADPAKRANFKLNFFLADTPGRKRLSHRTRYDARHPFQDVLKLAMHPMEGRRVYGPGTDAVVARLAERIQWLQGRKLARYVGWLVPQTRKKVGLHRSERQPDMWVALQDGYRKIVGFTDHGVRVRRFTREGETHVEVLADLVAFDSQAPPGAWEFRQPEASS